VAFDQQEFEAEDDYSVAAAPEVDITVASDVQAADNQREDMVRNKRHLLLGLLGSAARHYGA
jgi:hypothetical protein